MVFVFLLKNFLITSFRPVVLPLRALALSGVVMTFTVTPE